MTNPRDLETPRCDAVEDLINSRDYQPWRNLARQLERELRQARWIPVSERLPEYDVSLLIVDDGDVVRGWYVKGDDKYRKWGTRYGWKLTDHFEGDNYGYDGDSDIATGVTHWRPLPSPPEK